MHLHYDSVRDCSHRFTELTDNWVQQVIMQMLHYFLEDEGVMCNT